MRLALRRRDEDRRRRLEEAHAAAEAERLAQEAEYGADGEQLGSSSSDQEEPQEQEDPLYCIACDKAFKSEGALTTHERYVCCIRAHRSMAGALEGQVLGPTCDADTTSQYQNILGSAELGLVCVCLSLLSVVLLEEEWIELCLSMDVLECNTCRMDVQVQEAQGKG